MFIVNYSVHADNSHVVAAKMTRFQKHFLFVFLFRKHRKLQGASSCHTVPIVARTVRIWSH
jgi:hypothetical protein